jgi:hypothetical protein
MRRVHPKFGREPESSFGSIVDRLVAEGATSPETARPLDPRHSLGERVVLDANLRWRVIRVTPAGLYWVDEARRAARVRTQIRTAAVVTALIVVVLIVLELLL